jgi:hypothetical protein
MATVWRLVLLLILALLAPAVASALPPAGDQATREHVISLSAPRHPTTRPREPALRISLALSGVVLILVRKRCGSARSARSVDAALLALGVAGFFLWMPAAKIARGQVLHSHEFLHYYLNARYFSELGYTRLYECITVADAEDRVKGVRTRRLRNLENNVSESAATTILAHPRRCKRHFTPQRWREFRRDVRAFRPRFPRQRWERALNDHGFNGPPGWLVLGAPLARAGPPAPAFLHAFVLVDLLLLALAGGAIAWGFGVRVLAVAAIFLGSCYPIHGSWTAGAFLRQDWLLASVASLAFLRRGFAGSAGAALAWATFIRLFPALLLGGVAARALGRWIRQRRISLEAGELRLVAGGICAGLVLLVLSSAVAGSVDAWGSFAKNARQHLSTPLLNHMGLAPVVGWDSENRFELSQAAGALDPLTEWRRLRHETSDDRRVLYGATLAGFLALLVAAVRREPLWVAAVLGVGLIPMAAELTCYYLVVLLAYAFLLERSPAVVIGLLLMAALTQTVPLLVDDIDEVYVASSALVVVFVIASTAWLAVAPAANGRRLDSRDG